MDVDKHCKYFVKRKKRFCRMTVKSDKEYCGEHEPCEYTPETQATESKLRIVCPLDSKQYVSILTIKASYIKRILFPAHVILTN